MTFRHFFNKSVTYTFVCIFLFACGSNSPTTDPSQSDEAGTSDDSQEVPKPAVKILPLGDSITQGGSGYASYRRNLWLLLKDAGYKVDFIGSQDDFHGEVADKLKDFDQDHEGHWAWETGELDLRLEGWLDGYQADIVLLHVGTNDFDRGQSNQSTMQELASIIDKLRNNNSNVVILLAKIIPMKNKETNNINESIVALAEAKSTEKSPVVIVDQHQGYNPLVDNHDNYHPNTVGESKIATKWFNGLEPYLEK
jgi:lysophospholipase L1-like esterase